MEEGIRDDMEEEIREQLEASKVISNAVRQIFKKKNQRKIFIWQDTASLVMDPRVLLLCKTARFTCKKCQSASF